MTDAQAAIWREAVHANKEGSERERLSALVQEAPMTHSLDDALVEKAVALREKCRIGVKERGVMPDYCDACVALRRMVLPLLDELLATRAALEAAGVAELREALTDAHAAIVASNGYIALLQAYVEATELFLLTQDGAICGLSGGSDDPGRGAKKAWNKFVSARIAIGKHEAAALTNQGLSRWTMRSLRECPPFSAD